MKKFKLIHGKPITESRLITLMVIEAGATRKIAREVFELLGKSMDPHDRGVVLKSSCPKTKRGQSLACIRNDISHIRVYLQALKHQHEIIAAIKKSPKKFAKRLANAKLDTTLYGQGTLKFPPCDCRKPGHVSTGECTCEGKCS